MLRIELWTSDFDLKKCSKRPWDPHNRIRLENYAQKWSQILKTLDR